MLKLEQKTNIIEQDDLAFFDMKDSNDLYNKLRYEFEKLSPKSTNVYELMNFIFTANHLYDWIKFDKKVSIKTKKLITKLLPITTDSDFGVLRALCNRSKHFNPDQYDKSKGKCETIDPDISYWTGIEYEGTYFFVVVKGKKTKVYDLCSMVFSKYTVALNKIEII